MTGRLFLSELSKVLGFASVGLRPDLVRKPYDAASASRRPPEQARFARVPGAVRLRRRQVLQSWNFQDRPMEGSWNFQDRIIERTWHYQHQLAGQALQWQ